MTLIESEGSLAPAIPGVEATMLSMPQAECPVVHRFGPGIYIREMLIPAGTLILGHSHKTEHINVMLEGVFAIVNEDRSVTVLEAPFFFVGKAGRKIGYALRDTVWQNIYATDETDLDKLEEMFIDKSDTFLAYERMRALEQDAEQHEESKEAA